MDSRIKIEIYTERKEATPTTWEVPSLGRFSSASTGWASSLSLQPPRPPALAHQRLLLRGHRRKADLCSNRWPAETVLELTQEIFDA